MVRWISTTALAAAVVATTVALAAPRASAPKPTGNFAFVNAVGRVEPVYRMSASGGAAKPIGPEGQIVWALSWSPEGRRIAYIASGSSGPRAVAVLGARSGRSRVLLEGEGDEPTEDTWFQIAWAPDGKRIAVVRGEPGEPHEAGIDLIDLDGTVQRRQLAPDASSASGIAWSPDGRRLVYRLRGSSDRVQPFGKLRILTVSSGKRGWLPVAAPGTDPAWSPDGKWIAFASQRGIATARIDGSAYRLLTHGGKKDKTPTWSPDGHWIAFAHESGVCNKPKRRCFQDLYRVAKGGGDAKLIHRSPKLIETNPVWGR
jgi:Tol biopolymer transport system component